MVFFLPVQSVAVPVRRGVPFSSAPMSRLFFAAPTKIRLVMLLMAVLPCVPGIIFLLAGLARDPHRSARPPTPMAQAGDPARGAAGARALQGGGRRVVAGVLCGNVVVWQIIRRRDEEEDEDKTE